MARSVATRTRGLPSAPMGTSVATSRPRHVRPDLITSLDARSLFVSEALIVLQILKNILRRYIQKRISQRTRRTAAPCSKGS